MTKELNKSDPPGKPIRKFEHDLDWPDDVDNRYSPEFDNQMH